ncbi:hypothetical protein [Streptomyces sp. KR80]|uniref:hypothetical protein n=1 Tax=Streptomyces sp. KR80 TaxID=3457426 RepID=UPI003FD5049D
MSALSSPPVVRADQRSPSAAAAGYGGVVAIAVFFGSFILGLMFHSALATSTYPAADDAAELIVLWRMEDPGVSRISGAALCVSALVFAWFSAWFSAVVHRTGRVQAALVTFAGGLASALGLLLSGVLQWVAQRPENIAEEPVLLVVHQITFVLGGPMVVISLAPIVAVGGLALMRAKLLPAWLGWTGVVLGALALGSVVMLLPEDGSLTYLVPLGRFLSLLWLTVVAMLLARRRGREPAGA